MNKLLSFFGKILCVLMLFGIIFSGVYYLRNANDKDNQVINKVNTSFGTFVDKIYGWIVPNKDANKTEDPGTVGNGEYNPGNNYNAGPFGAYMGYYYCSSNSVFNIELMGNGDVVFNFTQFIASAHVGHLTSMATQYGDYVVLDFPTQQILGSEVDDDSDLTISSVYFNTNGETGPCFTIYYVDGSSATYEVFDRSTL